jgi:Ser-tRNA(Ala) deacylase AlaX
MTNTILLYLEDMYKLNSQAKVIDIIKDNEMNKIVLDQTVFYPQGGGQPSDKGTIQSSKALFEVQKVLVENGIAYHNGFFEDGFFDKGEVVELQVDKELRDVHNKNHTAGHLIDYGLYNLDYRFVSGKAYHFPQGPYVEYEGTLEQVERDELLPKLEKAVNDLVYQALPVSVTLLENDPQKRVMIINGYEPILCGGTHVLNTKDIGHIAIRKIKNEKGNLRISYAVT